MIADVFSYFLLASEFAFIVMLIWGIVQKVRHLRQRQ
jgi:hypothetical protein